MCLCVCGNEWKTKGGDRTADMSGGASFSLHNEIRGEFASFLTWTSCSCFVTMMNGVCLEVCMCVCVRVQGFRLSTISMTIYMS